mmetsp:Transcript_6854/g.11763  ORF Transcript_6854/g.11763 Transcript_6854/m.11763 type:complete len:247 (+) Transcript_6854:23-763(+)
MPRYNRTYLGVLSCLKASAAAFAFLSRIIQSLCYCIRRLPDPGKLPKHLAFLVEDVEHDCLDEICKLISWSFSLGIRHLTIMVENQSVTRENVDVLYSSLQKQCGSQKSGVTLSRISCNLSWQEARAFHEDPALGIHMLGVKEGRFELVSFAKQLAWRSNLKTLPEIDPVASEKRAALCDSEYAFTGVPDPDLLMICTGRRSYGCFPPWNIRWTEILFMGPPCTVARWMFLSGLQRYSVTKQRYGR